MNAHTKGSGEITIHKSISELLPALFEADPPRIEIDDPTIITGAYLKTFDLHLLPAATDIPPLKLEMAKVTLHPAFGSYGVLKRVVESQPKDYYKTLWSKSSDVPTWIGSFGFDAPFDDMVQAFSITKFGGARVVRGSEEALVTLGDVVGLIKDGKLSTGMRADEVSSIPIAISRDSTVLEALRKMVDTNVRRLFVEKEQGRFISDRTAIDYMFSPRRLGIARDHPEQWLDGTVAQIEAKEPGRCRSDDLDEAAQEIGPSPDDCLMTDKWRVVSRWDMVVKPWRAGKLAEA